MRFLIRTSSSNLDYNITVGEHFLLDVIQEKKGVEMCQLLEQRIVHLVGTLEKCIKIRNENLEEVEGILRNEIHLRYDSAGIMIPPPTIAKNSFRAVIQFKPRNWNRYSESYRFARGLCKTYATDQVHIVLEPMQ